jgi:hypothetical protein
MKHPRRRLNPEDYKKLDEFVKPEAGKPPNAPATPHEPEEQNKIKVRPMTRNARVEEQRHRPEVKHLFNLAAQEVNKGTTEETATRWLEKALRDHKVPDELICQTIIDEKKCLPEVWKYGLKSTYNWLSQDCKDKTKSTSGKQGGIASAIAKELRKLASSVKQPETLNQRAPPAWYLLDAWPGKSIFRTVATAAV